MKADRFRDAILSLGAIKIKDIAHACGSVTTGTKPTLVDLLYRVTCERVKSHSEPFRLISIDLGIKNIGITRVLAPPLNSSSTQKPIIEKWYRDSLPAVRAFTYPEFADAAIEFTSDLIKQSNDPVNGVIMERQRPRTSGSPNIPTDVLKVNIMEGMAFTALRVKYPDLFLESVPPKYILGFWKPYFDEKKAKSKKTAAVNYRLAKQARQQLVGKWLSHPKLSPVDFDTHGVRELLSKHGKSDDINDALVQALTWLVWRRNAYRLVQNIESGIDPMFQLEVPRTAENLYAPS